MSKINLGRIVNMEGTNLTMMRSTEELLIWCSRHWHSPSDKTLTWSLRWAASITLKWSSKLMSCQIWYWHGPSDELLHTTLTQPPCVLPKWCVLHYWSCVLWTLWPSCLTSPHESQGFSCQHKPQSHSIPPGKHITTYLSYFCTCYSIFPHMCLVHIT